MEIKKITTEVGIGYISGAEENQIRSLEPARKEFYEAFIKFSESLSGLGVENLLKKKVKWTMNKCTAVFSAMTEEELEIIDRVHENENELSEIQLLNKVNQCLLSKKDRKENLMEAAVLIIEAANKEGK